MEQYYGSYSAQNAGDVELNVVHQSSQHGQTKQTNKQSNEKHNIQIWLQYM